MSKMRIEKIRNCTLYCADCEEVFPLLATDSIDIVIDDPPFVNLKGGTDRNKIHHRKRRQSSISMGDMWEANLNWTEEAIRIVKYGIGVWCAGSSVSDTAIRLRGLEYIALLVWYKRNSPPTLTPYRPRYTNEYCWLFQKKSGLLWGKLKDTTFDINMPAVIHGVQTERIVGDNGLAFHPCQKPVVLTDRILACGGESVGDFHMGTGSTGVSAVKAGKSFIGIERDEKYFECACTRIENEYRKQDCTFPECAELKQRKFEL